MVRPRPLQRLRRLLGRRAEGALPQALSPQLRRLRRGALLRLGPGADPAPARRDPRRADDLRGHLAAGAARHRSRARRRGADRQPLGLPVLRRQGRGPGGDAGHPRPRQLGLSRLLQSRRRPGRAALRRALGRARRRGRGTRPRPRLRGGAACRRPRSERGDREAAPRRPPPCPRARARGRARAGGGRARKRTGSEHEPARRHGRAVRRRARADAQGARAGAAGLRRQERLRRRRPRALRRDRLGARRHARRRRARAGARPLRLDAVALLLRGHADRRAAPGGQPRLRLPRDPDRGDGRRLPRRRRGRRPGSPRRTCRPGCAG